MLHFVFGLTEVSEFVIFGLPKHGKLKLQNKTSMLCYKPKLVLNERLDPGLSDYIVEPDN